MMMLVGNHLLRGLSMAKHGVNTGRCKQLEVQMSYAHEKSVGSGTDRALGEVKPEEDRLFKTDTMAPGNPF